MICCIKVPCCDQEGSCWWLSLSGKSTIPQYIDVSNIIKKYFYLNLRLKKWRCSQWTSNGFTWSLIPTQRTWMWRPSSRRPSRIIDSVQHIYISLWWPGGLDYKLKKKNKCKWRQGGLEPGFYLQRLFEPRHRCLQKRTHLCCPRSCPGWFWIIFAFCTFILFNLILNYFCMNAHSLRTWQKALRKPWWKKWRHFHRWYSEAFRYNCVTFH